MNRTIAIIAAIVVVIGVWYFGFRSQPEVVPEATTTTETTTAPAATTETTTAPAATTETTTAPAATTETTTAPASDTAALLDPANFDADKLKGVIDASTLDDATKTTLKSAVDAAKASPDLVQSTLDQIKAALGM
jgi:cytoskeletal protein RodZ